MRPDDEAMRVLGRPPSTLDEHITVAHALVDRAIEVFVTLSGHRLAGCVVLFSGGNDSTVLAHLMRERATHFAHANTGIGVEQTREFVRSVSAGWDVPLIEKRSDEIDSYRSLVLEHGFPGPGQHFTMYRRLKERALRKVRAELVSNGRAERVLFLGGIRRAESDRRSDRDEMHRDGSIVWVSPIVHWGDQEMAEYRERHDVPRNEVSDHLHMSGECLCGAFAKPGELEQIRFFYPDTAAEIDSLADEARAAGVRPDRCVWGWGAWDRAELALAAQQPDGKLCASCRLFDPDNFEAAT